MSNQTLWIGNGRIWDGEQFRTGNLLIEHGRIAAWGDIPAGDAAMVYDAAGKLVAPGLVDIHVHMRGISSKQYSIQAEMSCFPFGVTAAADASGVLGNRELLESFQLKSYTFVPVDIRDNRAMLENTDDNLNRYGNRALGLKVFFDTGSASVEDVRPLAEICAFARERNIPVMVHTTGTPVPMTDLVETLNPGDILSHAYHGGTHTSAADDFRALKMAREKGVVIDAGLAGHIHTNFRVLRDALAAGYTPDTISTDITSKSAYTRGGRYGMTMCMNILRDMGMEETAVLKAVTSTPAAILGQPGLGRLTVGGPADLTVLEETDTPYSLTDWEGNTVSGNQGYRCCLTIADGTVVYCD